MEYSQNIGDIIKYHRKKAGLSQKSLADLAGLGKTVVFDIEKGKETVRFNSIVNVLKALNIHLSLNSPLMDKYDKEHENS
jgi:HTH-type transcriptional regulator / antitoxin HipB